MSLTPETKPNTNTISSANMKPGQIGKVVGSHNNLDFGLHLLRAFEQIVLMEDPSRTWMPSVNFEVELIPDGTTFTYKAPD